MQEHTASIYFKEQSDTFQVVTTIARNNGDGMPKRFIAELMPRQTATIAVGAFDPSASPVVLELHHNGKALNAQVLLPDATNEPASRRSAPRPAYRTRHARLPALNQRRCSWVALV